MIITYDRDWSEHRLVRLQIAVELLKMAGICNVGCLEFAYQRTQEFSEFVGIDTRSLNRSSQSHLWHDTAGHEGLALTVSGAIMKLSEVK